ncbi:hypothetical protein GCM10010384_00830 [Streptomyces djakartensis]|uniref:Uncharacterized protein n=1 Tax=Streptomyces djakartensis TaxID=68193 RepID=A0ABQ2Z273_9ACTN|nr:hypothetical protein GCM10010384_00830 [Streptomyces djakartensis]
MPQPHLSLRGAAIVRSKPVFGAQTTRLNMRRLCVVQSEVWMHTNGTTTTGEAGRDRLAAG